MISMQLCGHRKAAMAAMSEWIDRRHCRRLRHCLGHRKLGRRLAAMTPAGTPRGGHFSGGPGAHIGADVEKCLEVAAVAGLIRALECRKINSRLGRPFTQAVVGANLQNDLLLAIRNLD